MTIIIPNEVLYIETIVDIYIQLEVLSSILVNEIHSNFDVSQYRKSAINVIQKL